MSPMARAVRRERWRGHDVLSYPDRPATIVHILDRAVRHHGGREGVVDGHQRCTYRQLAERVSGTVDELADRGLHRGAAVGVVAPNSVDLAVLVFACAVAGVTLVGLSERDAPRRWAALLATAGATTVLASTDHAGRAATVASIADHAGTAVMDLADVTRARVAPWAFAPPSEDDTYMVVGTAGTTGTPKASRVVHRCSVHAALSYVDLVDLGPSDRTAVLFPLTYISALHAHVLPMMLAGGVSVLATPSSAHRFCDLLAEERITWMYTVPSFWLSMLHTARFTADHLPALRVAAFGGGPFPPDMLPEIRQRLPAVALHNVYGLSETHSPATILHDHEFADRPTSVGRPLPCMEARVVDDGGAALPPGTPGHLQLRGSLVTTGYLGDPDATGAAFDGAWFATGDHGRMDADGYVWIVARRRDLIVRGGYNIAPVEIEQALRRHPGIAEAAVFGVAGAAADPAVACAIVPERNRACPTARDVRAWVRDHVADYAVPRYVEVVDTIPLTPIGKVNRRALTDAALGRLGAS